MTDETTDPVEEIEETPPGTDPPAEEPEAEPAEEIDNQDEDKDIEEDNVPIRNNAAQIIARKNRQLEKLRAEKAVEDEPDEDGPVTKDPRVDALIEAVVSRESESELQGLFVRNPEAKKFEKRIKSYMKVHPTATPDMIYHHLAFSAQAIANNKAKEVADIEAGHMKGGGTSRRPSKTRTGKMPTADEIQNMSDEEFEKLQQDVQVGKYGE